MGRPSSYTDEIAQTICERIAQGESVRAICEDDDMPAQSSVYLWLTKNKQFSEQYAHAREGQCEHFLEEIMEIADEEPEFHHHVGWARNRIDTRKWAMSKLAPKKYGDKILHAGHDDGPVKIEEVRRIIVQPGDKDRLGLPAPADPEPV